MASSVRWGFIPALPTGLYAQGGSPPLLPELTPNGSSLQRLNSSLLLLSSLPSFLCFLLSPLIFSEAPCCERPQSQPFVSGCGLNPMCSVLSGCGQLARSYCKDSETGVQMLKCTLRATLVAHVHLSYHYWRATMVGLVEISGWLLSGLGRANTHWKESSI